MGEKMICKICGKNVKNPADNDLHPACSTKAFLMHTDKTSPDILILEVNRQYGYIILSDMDIGHKSLTNAIGDDLDKIMTALEGILKLNLKGFKIAYEGSDKEFTFANYWIKDNTYLFHDYKFAGNSLEQVQKILQTKQEQK